jgi:hypothetical protein
MSQTVPFPTTASKFPHHEQNISHQNKIHARVINKKQNGIFINSENVN